MRMTVKTIKNGGLTMRKDYAYPEGKADVVWSEDDIQYSVMKHPSMNHYCGYCRFEERPTIEQEYSGILNYVPVHGGLTYARQEEDGTMVYGFDCAHAGDELKPELMDISWLKEECRRMALGIQIATKYEEKYLTSKSDEGKAETLDAYHNELETHGIQFVLQDNFGAMIHVMFGGL